MAEEIGKLDQFAIFAEAIEYDRPLIMTNLTFARLIDDIIIPYDSNGPFFIDGAPLKKEKLKKLKIIRQKENFKHELINFHHYMKSGTLDRQKLYGEQYSVRLEALLRDGGEDVTSQIIQAFDRTIKPSIIDYLPKREELIGAALRLFIESLKALGSS